MIDPDGETSFIMLLAAVMFLMVLALWAVS